MDQEDAAEREAGVCPPEEREHGAEAEVAGLGDKAVQVGLAPDVEQRQGDGHRQNVAGNVSYIGGRKAETPENDEGKQAISLALLVGP